jgi:hypothetical protein
MMVKDTILGRISTCTAPKPWIKFPFLGQPNSVVLGVNTFFVTVTSW